jgi:hypothetical protein
LHIGVEVGDEAHPGPRDLSDQGATLQGGDWLVKDPKAWDWLCGYWASDEFRAMLERNQLNWQSKPSVHRYDAYGHVCKTQRMEKRLIISILNFCRTNLFNFVLQKNILGSILITLMFGSLHIKATQMQWSGW